MLFRRSVSSLVAKFDKLEDQLIHEAHALRDDAATLDVEADDLNTQAVDLQIRADEKRAEADRALRISARIDGLTS